MAIGKKKRFDVFKRDGFKCKYCGQSPPGVVLEVDHLDPKCNGGSDDEHNLITSCFDCNRGKGGTPLSVTPGSVDEQLAQKMEVVAQLTAMNEMLRKSHEAAQDHVEYVANHWSQAFDWEMSAQSLSSVRNFLKKLPIDRVLEAVDIAAAKLATSSSTSKQFKYFCGVCWGMIKEDQE
jgi:hypothetical protein